MPWNEMLPWRWSALRWTSSVALATRRSGAGQCDSTRPAFVSPPTLVGSQGRESLPPKAVIARSDGLDYAELGVGGTHRRDVDQIQDDEAAIAVSSASRPAQRNA